MGFDQLQANGNPSIAGFYSTSAPMGLASQQALQAQQIMGQQGLLAANNRNEQQKYQVMMQMAQQEQAAKERLAQQAFLQQLAQQRYVAQQLQAGGVNAPLANAASFVGTDNNTVINELIKNNLEQRSRQEGANYLQAIDKIEREAFEKNPANKGKAYQPSSLMQLLSVAHGSGAKLSDLNELYKTISSLPIEQQKAYASVVTAKATKQNADTAQSLAPSEIARNYGSAYQSTGAGEFNRSEADIKREMLQNSRSLGVAGTNPVDVFYRAHALGGPSVPGAEVLKTAPNVPGSIYVNDNNTANTTAQTNANNQFTTGAGQFLQGASNFVLGKPTTQGVGNAVQGVGQGIDSFIQSQQEGGLIPNFVNFLFPTQRVQTPQKRVPTNATFIGK